MKKGFTLIELLVVIAVIATLITVGLSSFATAQKKGRDSKRKSDMRDIHNALEQYYAVCTDVYTNVYPTINPDLSPVPFYDPIVCPNPSLAIMPAVPDDPRKANPYYCQGGSGNCNQNGYTICAALETDANPFCVSNSQ